MRKSLTVAMVITFAAACSRQEMNTFDKTVAALTPTFCVELDTEAGLVFADFQTSAAKDEFKYVIKSSMAPNITALGAATLFPTSPNGRPRHIEINIGTPDEGAFLHIYEKPFTKHLITTPTSIILSGTMALFHK